MLERICRGFSMQESRYVLELKLAEKLQSLKRVLEERFGPLSAELVRRVEASTDANKA